MWVNFNKSFLVTFCSQKLFSDFLSQKLTKVSIWLKTLLKSFGEQKVTKTFCWKWPRNQVVFIAHSFIWVNLYSGHWGIFQFFILTKLPGEEEVTFLKCGNCKRISSKIQSGHYYPPLSLKEKIKNWFGKKIIIQNQKKN